MIPCEELERRRLLTAVVLREQVSDFGSSEFADDVAVQRDGRVLVLGHTQPAGGAASGLFLARYDIDGTLDTSFGTGGRIFGGFDEFPSATSMAIDRSGRIVVAGTTNGGAVAAMRFTRSGFVDQSFGNNGLATIDAGAGKTVNDVAVDSTGRVIVAGQTLVNTGSPTPTPEMLVARFDFFGQPDTSFGGGDNFGLGAGFVAFPVGIGESGATSLALDSDNRILVGGFGTEQSAGQPAEKRFALARLDFRGNPDEHFGNGNDGIVVIDVGLPSTVQSLARAKDGKIVAVGNTLPTDATSGEQIIVARFDRGGSLDSTFSGGDGLSITGFGGARSQIARDVAIDSQQRILIAGEIADAGDPTGDLNDDQLFFARYLTDGTSDTAFAPGGALIDEIKPGPDSIEQSAGLAVQRNGNDPRVFLTGNVGTSASDQDIAVVRVATDATQRTGSAQIHGQKLVVKGSDRADTITVSPSGDGTTIEVNVNGDVQTFNAADVSRIEIGAKDGDDDVSGSVGGAVITTILGGNDDDTLRLLGDAHGRLEGGNGDDELTGGIHGDRLRGESGDDRLFGGDGNDDLTGDAGRDQLFGEAGNDHLKADDAGSRDEVDGGDGDDTAIVDAFDFVTRVDDVKVR